MMSSAWAGKAVAKRQVTDTVLSDQARLKLLGIAFKRLVFGVHAMPFVGIPFMIWMVILGLDIVMMLFWLAAYGVGNVWAVRQKAAFRHDIDQLPAGQALQKWLAIVHKAAIVHGLGVSVVSLITAGRVSHSFIYVLTTTQMAIVAGNATHQSPEIGTFKRFFATSWGGCILLIPWTFPDEWPVVFFLALFYVVSIYRHAMSSHRFFVEHAQLEEDSKKLADGYRVAKEEAEAALQAKNQFLTTASHDLRQPVHAMGFLIESIAHRNRDAALVPSLDDLRRSVRSVTLMFNSLLDLSRIESGTVEVNCLPVAFGPLMQDVSMLFREEAKSRGLDLRVHELRRPGAVLADPLLLRQAMVNLVHNALRYTARGGIVLGARRRGNHWRLEVWDTGMGIAGEGREKIYSPFYRDQHAWRIDSAGHGLGLAVVARCAGMMGATYGFDSVEGRGSRFWFQLPAADGASLQPAVAEQSDSRSAQRQLAGTCLVVEDDPQVSSAWLSLMQAWGVDARCAASATEAFAVLDAGFVPQAILCDQRLRSGESGIEVLKALFGRCPEASGAMVSGEFASAELQQAEREGYLVLRKPLETRQLHVLLEQWLHTIDR